MAKVTPLGLYQCVNVGDIFIKVYYAGHVLGAAMFYVRVGNESLVYTVRISLCNYVALIPAVIILSIFPLVSILG